MLPLILIARNWKTFTETGCGAACALCLILLLSIRKPQIKDVNKPPKLSTMDAYPPFVTEATSDKRGTRMLIICGKEYKAYPYDSYVDEAIELASYWRDHQVTYERIVHLRTWIRENQQHGYDIPYMHPRNMRVCRYFVEMVIHSEFLSLGDTFKEAYESCLQENLQIFSKGKGKG